MTEMKFVVDKEKCIHCGLCVKDCSVMAIGLGENKTPKVLPGGESRCFRCQHCMCICPVGAISIMGKNPENSPSIKDEVTSEELLNLMQSRRSCRHYKQENVSEEDIKKLKNVLNYPPTGCNDRGLHFAIIDNIDVMNKFRDKVNSAIVNAVATKSNQLVVEKFGDVAKMIEHGRDLLFRGAPHMVIVSVDESSSCKDIDPIIALSYFELYAKSLGLGTCWCGFVYWALTFLPELQEQLQIPENHKLSYVMLFGKPENKYKRCIQPNPYPITMVK
ncbi:MAG: nitroreductase family protein [Clostridiaceae bacterium]|jgi:nitroreductase/NAD-dependent dihydropyrimidine dehydrogenase PreA subunit|nr:nitroreductase family protein [Clostridiaceae bacterium]